MTRSGIKRGLAVSAVSALSVTGLAGTAHAVVTPVSAVSATASSTSVLPYQLDNVSLAGTVAVPDASGTQLSVTVTQKVASNAAVTISVDGTEYSANITGTAAPYTATVANVPVTLDAHGKATVAVGSSSAGDVTVTATSAQNASGSASFTVNKSVDAAGNANKVSSITGQTSADFLLSDWDNSDPNAVVTDLAKDATGTVVGNVPLSYQVSGNGVTGGTTTNVGAVEDLPATALDFGADPYSIDFTAADLEAAGLPDAAGTYGVRVFADTNGNNTFDNGEPNLNTVIHIAATTYDWNADTISSSVASKADSSTGVVADLVKSGTTSIPVSLTVKDSAAKPLANAPVAFDVTLPDGSVKRVNATTDSSGNASTTVTVPADQAKAGNTVQVEVFNSKSNIAGVGLDMDGVTYTYADAKAYVTVGGGTNQVQAVPGGQVTIKLTEHDQWGDAMTHQLRFAPGSLNTFTAQTLTPSADGSVTFTYTDSKATVGASEKIAVDDVTVNPAAAAIAGGVNVVYVDSIATASVALDPSSPDWGKQYATTGFSPLVGVSSTVKNTAAPGTNDQSYTVVVTNAGGSPLVNSPVTFTVDKGFVSTKDSTSPTVKNAGAASSQTVWTDASGHATVYVGSTQSGVQTLTATDGAATFKATPITYVADSAYSLSVSIDKKALTTGDSTKVLAHVTDEFGNAPSGSLVSFNQSGVGAFAGGASSIVLAQPDSAGNVTATLDAGSVPGNGAVSVSLSNGLLGSTTVPVNPNATVTTPNYTGPVSVSYSVAKPAVVVPPAPPKPAALTKLRGHSVGKKDVLVISAAHANGKKVIVKVHGHKVGKATIKRGKAVIKAKDHNGKKATKYVVFLGSIKKAFKVK